MTELMLINAIGKTRFSALNVSRQQLPAPRDVNADYCLQRHPNLSSG